MTWLLKNYFFLNLNISLDFKNTVFYHLDHHFFFAKLKIAAIVMLDTFGGPKYVTVKDYLHPPTPIEAAEFLNFLLDKSVNFEQQKKISNLENSVNLDVFLL